MLRVRSIPVVLSVLALWSAHSFSAETVDPSWETYAVGVGVKPGLAFGPDGSLHIMGMTEIPAGGEVWHTSAATPAGPWTPATVSMGYFYGPGDIVVDAGGTAHLAWHNHTEQDPNHATVEPGGATTVYRIVTPGNHDGWDNSLALDSVGNLHMASTDPITFGATQSLEYGTFDGNSWTFGTVPGSPRFMYGLATSIALDQNDDPHVVFCEGTAFIGSGTLTYAVRDSGVWNFSPVVGGENQGRFPALLLDSSDRPNVAWLDVDTVDTSIGYVRYASWNGSSWDIETVDTLANVELSHFEARKSVSIQFDSAGRTHIAYAGKRDVRYAIRSPGGWSITQVLSSSEDLYKGMVELALDGDERPVIAFWQRNDPDPGLVRLAVREIATGVQGWRSYY